LKQINPTKENRTMNDISDIKVDASIHRRKRPTYRHGTWRGYSKLPRVNVWPEGENLLENMANRFDRPQKLYRAVAKQALADLGITGTLRWSQKAGCSCGCSPGFILRVESGWPEQDSNGDHIDEHRFDIHVDAVIPTQEPTGRGLDRAAQIDADPTLPDLREYAV
jgi:hypothetical protein